MATDNKYDRQLRLWGPHGQKALSESKLCLINAGPTGSETLKNLVLPGCGHFVVVDAAPVTAGDVGNNFFVTVEDMGRPRAQVVTELLMEMNPDVSGTHRAEDAMAILASEPDYFKQFTLVIATQLPEADAVRLTDSLYGAVPVVLVRSYGQIASCRLVAKEHNIVESKPDLGANLDDLRCNNPWPELQALADSVDLDTVSDFVHAHVPFVLLLLKARTRWMEAHGGALPANFAEKQEFAKSIESLCVRPRADEPGKGTMLEFGDEDNFMEAKDKADKVTMTYSIPDDVQAALGDPRASTVSGDSSNFWLLVAALKRFVEAEGAGQLPLDGQVPDMVASSDMFRELQTTYKAKAAADLAAFSAHLAAVLGDAGQPPTRVEDAEIARFCKNCRHLATMTFRPVSDEVSSDKAAKDEMVTTLMCSEMGEHEPLRWYLGLRAVDMFHATVGHYPGLVDADVEDDTDKLGSMTSSLIAELGLEGVPVSSKIVSELVRFGATELHTTAAFIAGIASQEIVKLITHQFRPMDNTHVYNGIATFSATYEL